uniref:PCI domain-containing protein n=1 Tax=Neobodo designis TaxID=312471 RepID=A0A7S1R2K9_NEODS
MPAEQVTAQSFIKNAEARIEAGRKQDALRELHTFFARSSRATFEWSPAIDEFIKLHAKLSIELRDDKCVWDAMSKFRIKFQQLHTLDKFPAVVGAYMGEAQRMLEAARSRAAAASSKPSRTIIGQAVRHMTGASLEALAEERSLEASFSLYHTVMMKCLKAIGMDGTLERFFQFAMEKAFSTYRAAQRPREFMGMCKVLKDHTDILTNVAPPTDSRLADHKTLLLSDKYFADNVQAIMRTKHTQLLAAAELGCWDHVERAMLEVVAIMTEFRRNGRAVPLQLQMQYMHDLKTICYRSKQHAFGAHAAVRYAVQTRLDTEKSAEERTAAATQAVLAVLCVEPASRKATVSIAHDQVKEKQNQLAKAFSVPTPPTRLSLTADLQRYSLLESADADARELFACLNNPQSVSVCQQAAPLLDKLAAREGLESLLAQIKDIAIRSLLSVVSSCFSHVSIKHFMTLVAFFPAEDFATKVEPIIVDVAADANSTTSVAIDDATASVRFDSTASLGNRAVGVESEFSQRLSAAVHNCFAAASASSKSKPVAPRTLAERIEKERTRVSMRAKLCDQRIDKQQEREKLAKEREVQRKAEDLERRQRREEERNEKRREAELRKVAKQVAAQEAVERRRWVIKQCMLKHKGFAAPLDIATLPQEEFAEALSSKLLEFRRKQEMTKESDTTSMDFFERACREEEIPLRQAHEEEVAAANARKFEERRENRRKQHREDWERALATKNRLAKFEEHRYKYESDLGAAIQRVTKLSKRDKEAADLDAFKEARAKMAAKAEDAAPAAAAPKEEAAPAKPAGGAWVPKSKRAA